MSATDDWPYARSAPLAFATAIRERPERREAILQALHRTRGSAFVEGVLDQLARPEPRFNDAEPDVPALSTLDKPTERALALVQLAMGHLGAIRSVLLPAYHRAVAALDTPAVKALVAQVICGVGRILDAEASIRQLVPLVGTSLPAASRLGSETPRPAAAGKVVELIGRHATLTAEIQRTSSLLAFQMSCQVFGGDRVNPRVELGTHVLGMVQLTYEAGMVVRLLDESEAIAGLLVAGSEPGPEQRISGAISEATRREALARLARWRARPAHVLFLARVLDELGVAHALQAPAEGGPCIRDIVRSAIAQARTAGLAFDVGPRWDFDRAKVLLSGGEGSRVAESAMTVYDMIMGAEPWARAGLLRQLDGAGLVDRLCRALPPVCVRELWQTVHDREASQQLEQYLRDDGGDRRVDRGAGDRGGGDDVEPLTAFLRAQDRWYHAALHDVFRGPSWEIHAGETESTSERAHRWAMAKVMGRAAFTSTTRHAVTAAGWFGAEDVNFAVGPPMDPTSAFDGPPAGRFVGDAYDEILTDRRFFALCSSMVYRFAEQGFATAVTATVPLVAAPYLPSGSSAPLVHQFAATLGSSRRS